MTGETVFEAHKVLQETWTENCFTATVPELSANQKKVIPAELRLLQSFLNNKKRSWSEIQLALLYFVVSKILKIWLLFQSVI